MKKRYKMDFQRDQYKLSQKFSFTLTILYTFIGIILAVMIGIVFSVITYYLGLRIIELALFIVVSAILQIISKKLARLAKVRNNTINFLMCLTMCCFTYYTIVCGFEYALLSFEFDSFWGLVLSPKMVIKIMLDFILLYPFVMCDPILTPSIASFYIVYTILALEVIIIFLPAFFALKINDYYCEYCQKWYKKYQFLSPSTDQLQFELTKSYTGSYANALVNLPFYTPFLLFGLSERANVIMNNPNILIYVYCQCLSCKRNSILSIEKAVLKREKEYFVTNKVPNPILVKNVYIDEQTDLLFTIKKQALY